MPHQPGEWIGYLTQGNSKYKQTDSNNKLGSEIHQIKHKRAWTLSNPAIPMAKWNQ